MIQNTTLSDTMKELGLCVLVPTYNNAATLGSVIDSIHKYTDALIVVDDGSTDNTREILEQYPDKLTYISYAKNKGKGHALKCGFNLAEKFDYKNVITIDSDGQHDASDIVEFVEIAKKNPGAFIAGQRITEGEMPSKSSFANKLSSFWVNFFTFNKLEDTQNGFRLYPLQAMKGLRPVFNRYEAELELIVRCAWKGIKIIPAQTHVYYPPANERITHFRPRKDFLRITGVNVLFVFLAIFYGYPSMFYHRFISKRA